MLASEYLKLIENKYEPKNDSALADLLKVRPPTIYRYKKESGTFDDNVAKRVAKLLDIDVIRIVIDMDEQRAIDPVSKKIRKDIIKMITSVGVVLCILCKKVYRNDFVRYSSEINI